MRARILAVLLGVGLLGAWGPPAEAQVNALMARVTANHTTGSEDFVNVTDLTWYVAANTGYAFVCRLAYTTNATSAGLRISMNGPAGAAAIRYSVKIATAATAIFSASQNAYDDDDNPDDSGGSTALPATIAGVIENGATAGTAAVRFRNGTGDSGVTLTVLRGSFCMVSR